MRIPPAFLLLSLSACLSTKTEVATCQKDSDCTARAAGLRCDTGKGLCVCDPASSSTCVGSADAALHELGADSSFPDSTPDSTVGPVVDVLQPQCTLSSTCGGATPICSGGQCVSCSSSLQCSLLADPMRGACTSTGACAQCASNADCSGTAAVCDPSTSRCVECLTSTTCGGAMPICTNKKCTACTTSPQCAALADPLRAACAGNGTCVQCIANTDCEGTSPVCDTATNTCQECLSNAGCAGATPICMRKKCSPCTNISQCAALGEPSRAVCASSGACAQCNTNGDCDGTTPVCDTTTNTCLQCLASASCGGNAPICANRVCTACTAASQCAGLHDPLRAACSTAGACVQCTANSDCSGATPVCDPTTNSCVQCLTSSQCAGTTPICTNKVCTGCTSAAQCAVLSDPLRAACAATGRCVQCTSNTDCGLPTGVCDTSTNACAQCLTNSSCGGATPLCSNKSCVGCKTSSQCAGLSDGLRAACSSSGACVQCVDNSTCSGVTPVCTTTTNACRACTADSECAGQGPGVCMSHQDNRCASNDETVVVIPGSTLPGSSSLAGKRLVVIRGAVPGALAWTLTGPQMTVVGQNTGTLSGTGTATVHVTGGDLYVRQLAITGGAPGLWIDGGGTVRLDHVNVSNNVAGGILLDGAGFSIVNTTVAGNGAVNSLDGIWAGLRLQNLPTATTVPKSLTFSTVSGNQQVGIACASATSALLSAGGVLAVNNVGGVDIGLACGFSSCGTASTTCGAQP